MGKTQNKQHGLLRLTDQGLFWVFLLGEDKSNG